MTNDSLGAGSSAAGGSGVLQPANLKMHETTSEDLVPMSFTEFMDSHGKVGVEFETVWKDFLTIFPSDAQANKDSKSFALAFANKVVFEISGEVRAIKPKGRDRSWNLLVPGDEAAKRPESAVNVASYKNVDAAHGYVYRFENRRQYLSIRLANMVAVEIMCEHITKYDDVSLTPLGGAVYSMKDVPALATQLGLSNTQVACLINRSTVGTPYQLSGSDFACAVTAVMCTTRKMKNQEEAKRIVNKVIKGYVKIDKKLIFEHVAIWAQYATGGIPEEYSIENLQRYMVKRQTATPN